MENLVSIVIVSYNSAEYIKQCLFSLLNQAYAFFEIIIYDNASDDGTVEIIECEFPTVHLIKGKENLGFAAGNNNAVTYARGDILVFINPDAFVQIDFLAPLVDFLNSEDNVGAAAPAIMVSGKENFLNAYGNRIHLSGLTYCYEYGRPNTRKKPFEVSAISGAAFAIRKDIFHQLGGFETSFFTYYEDTDLSFRIRHLGLSCYVVPASVVFHAYKESFHPQKVFFLERNRYLSLFSLFGISSLILMLPTLIVMEFITWGYCFMKGSTTIKAKYSSWVDVIRRSGWIKTRRKAYPVSRSMVPFVLNVFDEHLELLYVGSGILPKIASIAAWLSAAPSMAIIRMLRSHHP